MAALASATFLSKAPLASLHVASQPTASLSPLVQRFFSSHSIVHKPTFRVGSGLLSQKVGRSECSTRKDRRSVGARASSESQDVGPAGLAAIGSGLIAAPVVAWSLFTLKTTGCGLPPGPGGALGGLEGVSYLAVVGIVGWSIYTKVKTGTGLPQGPFGLLGAVEGLSYLALLAGIVVFGFQIVDYGFIPPPTPGGQCFG